MRRTDFYIREDQHLALKAIADKETTTISFVIRRLIDEGLTPKPAKKTFAERHVNDILGETTKPTISNPLIAKAVALAKEKDIKFTPVPKPERKKKWNHY